MARLCLTSTIILSSLILGVLASLFFNVSPSDVAQAIVSSETRFALRLTIITSLCATFIAILLGVPTGYLLARRSFKGKMLLDTLLDLPLAMTPLVAGVGLLFLFGQGILGKTLSLLGIHILFSPLGAVVAQTFIAAPIITQSTKAAFAAISQRYELAAQTLGLRPYEAFSRISLPMARHGILSGIVLSWARAVGEFGATLMVAGATRFRTETLPIAVYLNISSGELGIALSCAWILVATGFILLFLLKIIERSATPDVGRAAL
jgi:molybdate transport system permease protein